MYRMTQYVLLRRDGDALVLLRDLVADRTLSESQLESMKVGHGR